MKCKFLSVVTLFFLLMLTGLVKVKAQSQVTVIDSRHYSNVFSETRNYRIFLPKGYNSNPQKKYPVIYFLHGWSQRYFGSGQDRYAEYDNGNDNNGDNIEKFVSDHEVIVVKSDGYDRSANEEYYKRPYNMGPVVTYRQFPIYFPELINHIDASYSTLTDREHRGITGLSMGGFMAYLIGGKYPHLFSAVGSFCPSAEFSIGPKDFPVEYRHLEMYKNYEGINVRLNYGDKDFIRSYHEDRNRVWTQVLDNYEYKIYPGEHSTIGLGDMFEYLYNTFKNPPRKPLKWAHIDLYPVFSVWDYSINTDRNIPGFTILENVDARGFKCAVREFLPNGEVLSFVNVSIITPGIYEKNQLYIINDFDVIKRSASQKIIQSDNLGRLKISLNGSIHEIGINKQKDKPNISMVSFKIENMNWATHNKDVAISIELLNKGQALGKNIKAKLSTINKSTIIGKSESLVGSIAVNETQTCKTPFVFNVKGDSIEMLKFKLVMQDDSRNEWIEFFEIELKKDLLEIKDFEIADGKIFKVSKSGTDTDTINLGIGNGDGVANPGESIVILVKDQNKYWCTTLSSADKYVNPFGVNVRKSDNWGPFDNVGGSAKYNVPLLSSDCPEDKTIDFSASYWVPVIEDMHVIKQGKISIIVKGKDNTPPALRWVQIPGDNILQAMIFDGSKIKQAKATLIAKDNPGKRFDVELKDDGSAGDRVAADNVFSGKLPFQNFGFYRVVIEARDSFENKATTEAPGTFVLH